MPTLRTIIEFFLIFKIAFLLNKLSNLLHEYETLKQTCSLREEHNCFHAQQTRPIVEIESDGWIESASASTWSIMKEKGFHWMNSDSDLDSVQHAIKKQNKLAQTSISSSYPPDFVLNPSETGAVEIESMSSEQDANSVLGEMKATSIPGNGRVSENHIHIPSIQPSEKTSFEMAKDIKQTDQYHSANCASPPLHNPTSLFPVEERESVGEKDDYFNYISPPVEETHAADNLNNKLAETQAVIPLIKATDESEALLLRNVHVPETNLHSTILEAVSQVKKGHTVPLQESTSILHSLVNEKASPFSTDAMVANNGYESTDQMDDYSETANVPSPLEFHPFYHKGILEDVEVTKSNKDAISYLAATNEEKSSFDAGSIAKCSLSNPGRKHCNFKNICYNPQKNDFIFFKGPESVIESDTAHDVSKLFSISLSTLDHNTLMFSLITLPVDTLSQFTFSVIKKKSIAITRFKPDNIMHVLHDDILPLYQTLQHFDFQKEADAFDAVIVFIDSYGEGDYFDFYAALSNTKPLSVKDFDKSSFDLVCFSDIHVGLLTSTVWYDYGFKSPQGPLPNIDKQAFFHIQNAARLIVTHFQTECFLCNQKDYLVFLSRKDNRLILNEGDLILGVSRTTRLKVLSVSLETHSLAEIITIVKSSRGIIGMHGSLMVVSVFLPPGSVVIELFPYAVNPMRYTPFKTFTELFGSFLIYKSWVNTDRKKSISHSDWSPEEGGIQHLPIEEQREIDSQTEVPEHLCCNDPSWLYHIYQDTFVNVTSVASLTLLALQSYSIQMYQFPSLPDVPGSVENLQCIRMSNEQSTQPEIDSITVSWTPHWGLQYYPSLQNLRYEIIVQEQGSFDSNISLYTLDVLSYTFTKSSSIVINVWIAVIVPDSAIRSQSKYVSCH